MAERTYYEHENTSKLSYSLPKIRKLAIQYTRTGGENRTREYILMHDEKHRTGKCIGYVSVNHHRDGTGRYYWIPNKRDARRINKDGEVIGKMTKADWESCF